MLPGAAKAVRLLNDAGWPVVLATNQSGVARGYFPERLVDDVHGLLAQELAKEGARLDAIYSCFHHPEAHVEAYRLRCECRKPRPGLLLQAASEMDLDLPRSWLIGDRLLDIETAQTAGARGILVLTGYGRGEMEHPPPGMTAIKPDHVAVDILGAVRWLLEREKAFF
jgi:D-glycero-D-manno-heptose 1,7-bisphosphate phosphatase